MFYKPTVTDEQRIKDINCREKKVVHKKVYHALFCNANSLAAKWTLSLFLFSFPAEQEVKPDRAADISSATVFLTASLHNQNWSLPNFKQLEPNIARD